MPLFFNGCRVPFLAVASSGGPNEIVTPKTLSVDFRSPVVSVLSSGLCLIAVGTALLLVSHPAYLNTGTAQ